MATAWEARSGWLDWAGHLGHDAVPVRFRAPRTGLEIDLGAFSRERDQNTENSGTVMG
ncbi:hypothetical protein L6E12_28570 [Actinokineospora sp. PR83]|uniref:hypothetical protein n=1 Tax=Actinokineospora sp. PR83 TaxID=2884908 RepID=UPI001F3E1D5C|nr:hypothetical protein [Actinokineospora sp. PR83]MCG8919734.1 hypothetical protein [Actinokineospora sp. PR83]